MKPPSETERQAQQIRVSMQHDWDRNRTYHPVFCTTAVSDTNWAKFALADENPSGRSYLEISSTAAKSFKEVLRRQSENTVTEGNGQLDADFFNYTIDQVYDFWRQNVRAADDIEGPQRFSAFTFVVIDEACLNSEPLQCIVCNDGPDFGEADDAIVLKHFRVDVVWAWAMIVALEELTMTSIETEYWSNNLDDKNFSVLELTFRPPTLVPMVEDEVRNVTARRFATPAEARANKRKGIKAGEREGWVPLKGFPGGIWGVSYDK